MTNAAINYIISLMKIDLISLIGNEGARLPFSFEIKAKEGGFTIAGKADGNVSNLSGALQFSMNISANIIAECGRCLGEATQGLKFAIDETVDENAESLSGTMLNLGDIAMLNIFNQMPIKILCGNGCKGLCAGCGANLNTEKCKCNGETIDERLAVLKKLLD